MPLTLASNRGVTLPIKGTDETITIQPTNIYCLGKNFAAHAAETGSKPPSKPLIFGKSPSNLILDGDPIVIPRAKLATRIDHEVELAVIMAKGGYKIPAAAGMDYVYGYTVLNDVTARDIQGAAQAVGHPWFLSKNLYHSCPVGPVVVSKADLPDPGVLNLELRVNGEVRQQGSIKDLVFSIPTVIAYISAWLPIETGDLIAMGTPAGISPLKPRDVVEAEIDGIGVLRNPVEKAKK